MAILAIIGGYFGDMIVYDPRSKKFFLPSLESLYLWVSNPTNLRV